jgi:hypothetical protein
MIETVDLVQKFDPIEETWILSIAGEINNAYVKRSNRNK